ncbi:MAG: 5-carboxymethyl-2-hydroxymuconate Delta-isomerase [Halocynthiibacter sp.]
MPHIVLEYSENVADRHDIQSLCELAFDFAARSGVFPDTGAIKTRALPVAFYKIGTEPQSFLHVTIQLLDGRPIEVQKTLTSGLLDLLAKTVPDVGSLSVDIKETLRATYQKRVL